MNRASPDNFKKFNIHPHTHRLPVKVGTRSSPLALTQTRQVIQMLIKACPFLAPEMFEEHALTTTGDKVQDRVLADIGGKGLFAKELHEALADKRVDFTVHSLKDLETKLPDGIVLACTLAREDVRDVLILADRLKPHQKSDRALQEDPLSILPQGTVLGTSSVRRRAQLLHKRPDLQCRLLRGNVQTRLQKLQRNEADASLLALAGLKRLNLEEKADLIFSPDFLVPAAGQGIIGITARESDTDLLELLRIVEDRQAGIVASAERAFLHELDGSCRTPIGGYAVLQNDQVHLTGLIAKEDGSFLIKRSLSGPETDAVRLGTDLARSLRQDSPASVFEK